MCGLVPFDALRTGQRLLRCHSRCVWLFLWVLVCLCGRTWCTAGRRNSGHEDNYGAFTRTWRFTSTGPTWPTPSTCRFYLGIFDKLDFIYAHLCRRRPKAPYRGRHGACRRRLVHSAPRDFYFSGARSKLSNNDDWATADTKRRVLWACTPPYLPPPVGTVATASAAGAATKVDAAAVASAAAGTAPPAVVMERGGLAAAATS